MSNENGEEGVSTSEQNQPSTTTTAYPSPTNGGNPDKDFDSPYSIYMSQPGKLNNQYGAGAGSYGNQNYGFPPASNQQQQDYNQNQLGYPSPQNNQNVS